MFTENEGAKLFTKSSTPSHLVSVEKITFSQSGGGGADITLLDEIDFEEKKDNETYKAKAINDALITFNEVIEDIYEKLGALNEDYAQALSLIGGAE